MGKKATASRAPRRAPPPKKEGPKRGVGTFVAIFILGALFASTLQQLDFGALFSTTAPIAEDHPGPNQPPPPATTVDGPKWEQDGEVPLQIPSPITYKVKGDIPRIKWNDDPEFVTSLIAEGKPRILTDSPAVDWEATELWNPSFVEAQMTLLEGAFLNDGPVFGPYYANFRPYHELVEGRHNYQIVNVTSEAFWAKVRDPTDKGYIYWCNNANIAWEHSGPAMWQDIAPWEAFDLGDEEQNMNFWFGEPGVVTHTHYDSYNNLNVQLYGRKRWVLFDPAQAAALHPYPYLHPSHAQIQADIDAEEPAHPDVGAAEALVGFLEEGEVLFLPALWFHQVTALTSSISINFWGRTSEANRMRRAISMLELYMEKGENSKIPLIQRGRCLIFAVTDAIKGKNQGKLFVRSLIASRFANLFENEDPASEGFLSTTLDDPMKNCRKKEKRYYWKEFMDRDLFGQQRDVTSKTVELFKGIGSSGDGVLDLWLGNWVEAVASFSAPLYYTGAFLDRCF